MADTVTSQTLFNNSKRTIRKFTNISDGTGESDVQKIDISGLTGTPTAVSIDRVWYTVSTGMSVSIEFDHTSDDTAFIATGSGYQDFRSFGGITDPGSSGGTGDILFTTHAATSGESYTIILDIKIL